MIFSAEVNQMVSSSRIAARRSSNFGHPSTHLRLSSSRLRPRTHSTSGMFFFALEPRRPSRRASAARPAPSYPASAATSRSRLATTSLPSSLLPVFPALRNNSSPTSTTSTPLTCSTSPSLSGRTSPPVSSGAAPPSGLAPASATSSSTRTRSSRIRTRRDLCTGAARVAAFSRPWMAR